jgi:hypothetical protein
VSVYDAQTAIRKQAGERGIRIADLVQQANQGVALGLGVFPPIVRRGHEVAGPDAA